MWSQSKKIISALSATHQRCVSARLNAEVYFDAEKYWNKEEYAKFNSMLPSFIEKFVSNKRYFNHPTIVERFRKIVDYNVAAAEKKVSLVLLKTHELLKSEGNGKACSEEQIYTMAWILTMIHAGYTVFDDIQDGSKFRRGKQCWYTLQSSPVLAASDSCALLHAAYMALKMYFGQELFYHALVDDLRESDHLTHVGHMMEMVYEGNMSMFKADVYRTCAMNKAHYYIYQPIAAAIRMAGLRNEEETINGLRGIVGDIMYAVQSLNDHMDCYNSKGEFDTNGLDIGDGKCSWNICTALELANMDQLEVLKRCYGIKKREDVEAVGKVYDELKLPERFKDLLSRVHSEALEEVERWQNPSVMKAISFILHLIDPTNIERR